MPPQEAIRIDHDEAPSVNLETGSTRKNNVSLACDSSLVEDQQMLEDLRDVILALKEQEMSYTLCSNASNNNSFPLYFDTWRPVMVSWMYSVIDTFALNPLCVPTGMYYLDTCCRMLPVKGTTDNQQQQHEKELYPLMAMTSLNLAIKCHETRMFPLDQLVQLMGRGKQQQQQQHSGQKQMQYTPEDIIDMERRLLQGCQWKLHPATTHDFLHQFVQVLDLSVRDDVLERSITHLKNGLMWEHVLHQQHQQQAKVQQQHLLPPFQPFLPSTLAYASLLLAMEDKHLPLADKQACCLALLQVADLSTNTPHLSKAYNWLVYAKNLQTQLVAANQKKQTQPSTPAPAATTGTTRVVSPTTTATLSTGHVVSATKIESETIRSQDAVTQKRDSLPIVSPAVSTVTTMEDSSSSSCQGASMVVEETTVTIKPNTWQKQQHFRHPSQVEEDPLFVDDDQDNEEEDLEEEDDWSEVIFYSHTYTGDGFEVMTVDTEYASSVAQQYTDCQSFPLTSPHSSELSVADLVLTESLDEDGFEVSYANSFSLSNTGSSSKYELLASMLASPIDVVA
ncbi:cyclin-like protein [Nitzschia inconspicua]|uniref:Cyclin-like protein n=1 Tax=Nitzschia inconspicua TaxID=303405 RepID=A0A9K3PWG7_9STRA|nr:cyclin-like protein [Nitzschia inconspicua]